MKKRELFFWSLILIGLLLLNITSCKKNEIASNNPYNGKTNAKFNSNLTYGTMTDQDGNIYKTITIGTQTWMAENLRTTRYKDNTEIPNVRSDSSWDTLTTGAYCTYYNTENADSIATFGRLYNWYTISTGKLAPNGWHVPSNDEWTTLVVFLGAVAGGKLKEIGTTHWENPNKDADNSSGFTALPGGVRYNPGVFYNINTYGYWWSTTKANPDYAWYFYIDSYDGIEGRSFYGKTFGFSVRCVKDN